MFTFTINSIAPILTTSEHTVLEAMESAGLQAEYHCRDGHCGACRCELVNGEIEETGFKMAYTSANEILPCISKAKSNLVLSKVNYQIKAKSA
ncbi:2Fe-2S iron-sulfur cluster-binding protein [Vibrio algarum]|uniref:2Fe-2S iron-sulfur cluster-binding protein n=1 Tax=Vibrio algarum TaxID=3020714 RepID=A0ABT4YQA5_9VIBR|nr:2Fe-2S iron-sulfur cluster-binding protein [Vibrio sp. KJ40-1]MDB1123743.1 2Fe-2S iron-sulfur cluster-binding protein [Vibrio sp. KJ40-1]